MPLAGCHDDALQFTEALSAMEAQPQRAIGLCGHLDQQDLRDHCLVAVVESGALPEHAADLCGGMATPLWQDECWFVKAEREVEAGLYQQAMDSCQRSRRFAERCDSHLWRLAAAKLFVGAANVEEWAAATHSAVGLQMELSGDGALGRQWQRDMAWRDAMRMAMQRQRWADPALCDELLALESSTVPVLRPHVCLEILNAALAAQVLKVLPRDDGTLRRALCDRPPGAGWPGPEGGDLGWTDDERLHAGLEQAAKKACSDAR